MYVGNFFKNCLEDVFPDRKQDIVEFLKNITVEQNSHLRHLKSFFLAVN